jgi:hypothetical protein
METRGPIHRLNAFAGVAMAAGLVVPAGPALSGAITFNTALPVAQDTFVTRFQGIHRERVDDSAGGREVDVDGAVAALGYGFTPDWTGIAIASYLDKELTVDTPRGRVRRQADGLGDTTLLARYSAFERNAPGKLLRVAPIVGAIAPTGESDERDALGEAPAPLQPGAGSWGGVAGVIVTRQTLDGEFDAALTATTRGRDEGFEPGDAFELDASYQYRLPWPPRGAGAFSYAVLEGKAVHREDDTIDSDRVANGGTVGRVIPGLQYVTRRWVLEGAVELVLAEDLSDDALRDEAFWHVGLRRNF